MRKGLAVTLLILGGIAVYFWISIAVFWMLLYLGQFAIAAAIILTVGATFGISGLRGVYADRCRLSARKFLLCTYVSSAAASALFFLIAVCMVRFYAEFGWAFGIIWMIVSGAAVVLGAAMLAISAKLRAKKEYRIVNANNFKSNTER